jgi:hypothetical protein
MDRIGSQVQGDELNAVELFDNVRKMLSTVKKNRADRLISLYDMSYEEASKLKLLLFFLALTLS